MFCSLLAWTCWCLKQSSCRDLILDDNHDIVMICFPWQRQLWAQDMEHDQATSSMYQEIASLRKQVVTLMSDKIHLSKASSTR